MPSAIEHIENIIKKAGDLAETKAEIIKLRIAGKVAETISSLISVILIVLAIGTAVTILSMGAAYWIGKELGNYSYGFFIVGGFYFLAGLLLFLFRNVWIKKPFSNLIIDRLIEK